MPIVGEQAFRWILDAYKGDYLARFEFNMPAGRVFAKVCLTYLSFAEDSTIAGTHIETIKRKRPDGLIEEISVNSNAVYDDNMTNIKYFLYGHRAWLTALVVLEYWG